MDEKVLNRELFKNEKFQDELMGLLQQLTTQTKKDFDIILGAMKEISELQEKIAALEEQLKSK